MYKKIALIIPKHVFDADMSGILPHGIGIEYVAASIEPIADKVIIMDENCGELDFDELQKFKPDLVGIGMNSYQCRHVAAIASRIKQTIIPAPKIAVGGFHPTLLPDEVIRDTCIDFAIRGEGELTMRELVMGKQLSTIKGLSYKIDGEINHNPPRPLSKHLDMFAFPARHLRKNTKNYKVLGFPYESMMTSRGCLYSCSFCNAYNMHKGIWRSRSVKSILDEIESIIEKDNPRVFFFWDLDFMPNKKRLEDFCSGIKQRGIKIKFICMARVDSVLRCRDLLHKLHECGLAGVQIGLERPDDGSLGDLNKQISLSQSRECIKLLHDAGIFSYTFFIVGLPHDTLDMFQKCIDYADDIGVDAIYFLDPLPLPQTPFRREIEEEGFLKTTSWDTLHFGNCENIRMLHMTNEQLKREMKKYQFKYFARPEVLLRAARFYFNTFRPNPIDFVNFVSFTANYLASIFH